MEAYKENQNCFRVLHVSPVQIHDTVNVPDDLCFNDKYNKYSNIMQEFRLGHRQSNV